MKKRQGTTLGVPCSGTLWNLLGGSDIKNSRLISVLSDGSTDSGNIENELMYLLYIN